MINSLNLGTLYFSVEKWSELMLSVTLVKDDSLMLWFTLENEQNKDKRIGK